MNDLIQYLTLYAVNDLHTCHVLFPRATLDCSCSLNLPGPVLPALWGTAQVSSQMEPFQGLSLGAISLIASSNVTLDSKLSQVFEPFAMAQLHLPGTAWASLLKRFRGTF